MHKLIWTHAVHWPYRSTRIYYSHAGRVVPVDLSWEQCHRKLITACSLNHTFCRVTVYSTKTHKNVQMRESVTVSHALWSVTVCFQLSMVNPTTIQLLPSYCHDHTTTNNNCMHTQCHVVRTNVHNQVVIIPFLYSHCLCLLWCIHFRW